MTMFQVVVIAKDGSRIPVGPPHDFMSQAQFHIQDILETYLANTGKPLAEDALAIDVIDVKG